MKYDISDGVYHLRVIQTVDVVGVLPSVELQQPPHRLLVALPGHLGEAEPGQRHLHGVRLAHLGARHTPGVRDVHPLLRITPILKYDLRNTTHGKKHIYVYHVDLFA